MSRYLGPGISYKQLNQVLFDDYNMRSTIDLPSHLSNLESNIKSITDYTAKYLIDNHTLFPFYSPFLVKSKRATLVASMLSEKGNTIHTRLGINACRITRAKYPRFCPICIKEYYEEFGEAHWQLLHQIPSNNVCIPHKCCLQEYEPDIFEKNSSLYINANQALKRHQPIRYSKNKLEINLSEISRNILNQRTKFDINKIDYQTKITESRYQNGENLKKEKLQADFVKFYGETNLSEIIPFTKKSLYWVTDIVKRPTHYFDPVRHILINEFVLSLKNEVKGKQSPFGKGPWLCYNKICDKYLKPSITNFETHIDSKSNRLIGYFKCNCGFSYTRSFLNNSKGGTKEFIRIKERGDLWTDRLKKEMKLNKSLREVGRVLGADAKTIKALSEAIINKDQNGIEQRKHLKKNRAVWKKLLSKSEHPKVKSARKANPKVYSWLYRNDKTWLWSINAKYFFRHSHQLRINWGLRDMELAGKINSTHSKLIEGKFRGRITKSLLAREMGKESGIGKNLNKLPITNQLLIDFSENNHDYHLRKTRLVIKDLLSKSRRLKYWDVVRAAGIRKNFATSLRPEIERLILESANRNVYL